MTCLKTIRVQGTPLEKIRVIRGKKYSYKTRYMPYIADCGLSH